MWMCAQSSCHFWGSSSKSQGTSMAAVIRTRFLWNRFGRSPSNACHLGRGYLREMLMYDLTIALENRPGALAHMGDALGRAGVSIEGGGAFVVNGHGVAHFLFEDGVAARMALEAAGIQVLEDREVLVQRLNQTEPGQLGKIS